MSYRNPHLKGFSRWPWSQRLKARWWTHTNVGKSINRRVVVETYLLDVYHGKREPVEGKVALQLALHLGVPTDPPITLKQRMEKYL